MNTAITGTATTSRSDSAAPSRIARTTPPTHMIGAMTMSVSAICKNNWICWMSLVLRVISDGVPKWFISRAEKPWTRAEHGATHVRADAHRHATRPVHRDDGDDAEHQGDGEHDAAGSPDVVEVSLDDPVVDDVRVEVRQVEVPDGLEPPAARRRRRPVRRTAAGRCAADGSASSSVRSDRRGSSPHERVPGYVSEKGEPDFGRRSITGSDNPSSQSAGGRTLAR